MKKENSVFSRNDLHEVYDMGSENDHAIYEETTCLSFKVRKQVLKSLKTTLLNNIEYAPDKKN